METVDPLDTLHLETIKIINNLRKCKKVSMDYTDLQKLAEAYASVYSPQEVEEGVRDLDPEKGTEERKARLEKKRGMKMDDHPQYKKEEVESEAYEPMTKERQMKVDRAKKKAYDADKHAQYKGDSAEADKQFKRRMAMDSRTKMRKEELEASGLFTEEEINAILKADEQFDEAMSSYDRNRKRAAQRAAARNAARDAGKTGAVPGVGYVTPRRERETYTDEKGTVRHKSGAKMP